MLVSYGSKLHAAAGTAAAAELIPSALNILTNAYDNLRHFMNKKPESENNDDFGSQCLLKPSNF